MQLTPEMLNRIQEWRRKALDNTITQEELKQAIIILRESRMEAGAVSSKSRSKAPTKSADELLSEL